MGYTNYWTRTEKPITQEFVDGVKKIIADSEKKGITIRGWDGTGEPEVTLNKIAFNGNREYHLDHETCYFDNEFEDAYRDSEGDIFCFCKTAEKPYDYTVKEVLKLAKKQELIINWACDGECKVTTDADWRQKYGRH